MTLDNSLVTELRYEWFKKYRTEISEARVRKELKTLGEEPRELVKEALVECLVQTPARFFSWPKFRDTWRSYLKESGEDPSMVFNTILRNHTGYAPSIGIYWTITDIRSRFGDRAANAIDKIGGTEKLSGISTDQKPWLEREFIKAYGAQ